MKRTSIIDMWVLNEIKMNCFNSCSTSYEMHETTIYICIKSYVGKEKFCKIFILSKCKYICNLIYVIIF